MKPLIIGMAGGTASGKTTITQIFASRIGASVIGHDRYYHNVPDPRTFNYDHPDALDTALLVTHLDALRAGQPAALPVYHFATHRRLTETERVEPAPIMVVEGILVLSDPHLRARFDVCVWVDAPADIRLARRLLRDMAERGRSADSVIQQYLGTVRPMHEAFVAPSAAHATLTLDGTAPLEHSVARLMEVVRQSADVAPPRVF